MTAVVLFPAIDLRRDRVVRLFQGEPTEEFSYQYEPADYARRFVEEGAEALHVIDLGAAFGEERSDRSIRRILEAVTVPVQVGGGVRTLERLAELLSWGARWVLVGTKALTDPDFLPRAGECVAPERIMVALDFRGGRLAVRGWQEELSVDVAALGARLRRCGIQRVLVTAVQLDGTLEGPDVLLWRRVWEQTALAVIGAGGIGSLSDLSRLRRECFEGLAGVVVGRAIAEGAFTVRQALCALRGAEENAQKAEDHTSEDFR